MAIAVLPILMSSTGICAEVMLVEYPINSPDNGFDTLISRKLKHTQIPVDPILKRDQLFMSSFLNDLAAIEN